MINDLYDFSNLLFVLKDFEVSIISHDKVIPLLYISTRKREPALVKIHNI